MSRGEPNHSFERFPSTLPGQRGPSSPCTTCQDHPKGGQKKTLNLYLPKLDHLGTVIFSETAAQRQAVSFPRKRPTCRSASQRAEPGEDEPSAQRKGRTLPRLPEPGDIPTAAQRPRGGQGGMTQTHSTMVLATATQQRGLWRPRGSNLLKIEKEKHHSSVKPSRTHERRGRSTEDHEGHWKKHR